MEGVKAQYIDFSRRHWTPKYGFFFEQIIFKITYELSADDSFHIKPYLLKK